MVTDFLKFFSAGFRFSRFPVTAVKNIEYGVTDIFSLGVMYVNMEHIIPSGVTRFCYIKNGMINFNFFHCVPPSSLAENLGFVLLLHYASKIFMCQSGDRDKKYLYRISRSSDCPHLQKLL